MRLRSSVSVRTLLPAICLAGVVVLAVIIRCLHLLNGDHYYILSQDSHFFHWRATGILTGETIPLPWHFGLGLTYPLAWTARIISFVSGMSEVNGLTLASKLLPPAIGIVGMLVLYWGVSRMYSRRVGLWAALTWAVLEYAFLFQTAGYLDRDGLSMVLCMIGIFLFHFSRAWHFRVAGIDFGWAGGAVAVMGVIALLVYEWLWIGAIILLLVLISSVVAEVLAGFLVLSWRDMNRDMDQTAFARSLLSNGSSSLKQSNWRTLAVIVGLSLAIGTIRPGLHSMGVTVNSVLVSDAGMQYVGELQPLRASHLYPYLPVIVPLVVGIYIAVTKRRKADLLCLSWLVSLLLAAAVANRMFIYATPASCVLCGLGLASIFNFEGLGKSMHRLEIAGDMLVAPSTRFLRICGAVLVAILLLFLPLLMAFRLGSGDGLAANREWQKAIDFLKEDTPQDAVVMSWWDYGYWILDMADRTPVVDNGYYSWDEKRLEDVALVYCTADASEAARVMQHYGAEYLVFSRSEVAILPVITTYGLGEPYGDGSSVPPELSDSLFRRSLYGGFQDGGGLRRVYPSSDVQGPEVVVLKAG